MTTPEAKARKTIDDQLIACGWVIQDRVSILRSQPTESRKANIEYIQMMVKLQMLGD